MKKLYTILFCKTTGILIFYFACCGRLSAQTNVPGGDLRGTWTKANSPYVLTENVTIDSILVIEPGVIVQFPNNTSQLTVNGTLRAQGSSSDSIRFIGTGGFGGNTKTGPIIFASSSINSILQFVVIRGLGYYYNSEYTSAIQVNTSSCVIENCYVGYIRGAAFEINDVSPLTIILRDNMVTDSSDLNVILDLDKLKCLSGNNALTIGLTHDNDMLFNDTLTATNQFYRLIENQIIPQGKTLTINPNVIVQFKNNFSQLSVQGKLNAKGSLGNQINFTNVPGEGFGGNTETGPVTFETTSLTSTMDYVTVTGLGYYYNSDNTAAINIYSSFCTISNCNFNAIRGSAILVGNVSPSKPIVESCSFSQDIVNLYVILDFDKLKYLSGNNPLRVGLTHQNDMGQNDTLYSYNLFYRFLVGQTIPQSRVLTIEPGVLVQMPNNTSQFTIAGTLNAQGTADNPISLKGINGFGGNTETGPITFESTSKNSILNHVTIDGLGYYYNSPTTPGIIIETSSCNIISSVIENTRGLAVLVQDSSAPIFQQSCFSTNSNGAIRTVASRPRFINCNFVSNTSGIVNTTGATDIIDATNCWWGDASGPKQSITNPAGAGDSVSIGVLYITWAMSPFDCSEDASPVPITLLNFQASVSGSSVNCTWQTATESNTSYFIIEHSIDGTNFNEIGKVPATGNSNTVKSYQFSDKIPIDGINYYRLKTIDRDAKYTYSKVLRINISSKVSFVISPNPARENLFIQLRRDKAEKAVIEVTDMQGKILHRENQQIQAGISGFSFNISSLSKGVYILVIRGEKTETRTFIKE